MRIHVATLGCRLNQSESDRIARQFAAVGHEIVSDPATADLQIVNTCAVTHKATRESRQVARAGRRAAPGALTVVTGCASQIEPEYFAAGDGATLVTGHADKERLLPLLIERGVLPRPDPTANEAFPLPHTRTRAFVKIQDGCGNRCAYCVSRLARGEERSRPIATIVREAAQLEGEGFQEIVLTGLHAASYGRDFGADLTALVRALLAHTRIPRIRLSSLEPWGAPDDLLELWSDGRLCAHLHLPLQSGSDATLRRMRRGYNTRQFATRVESARQRVPGIAISTDVIVGFPGESDAEFADSLAFVRAMAFAQAHVFPFSPRAGTEASHMHGQIDPKAKQARSAAMIEATDADRARYRQALAGSTLSVLWEGRERDGDWSGLTGNYVRVYAESDADLNNQITAAHIGGIHGDGMIATVEAAERAGKMRTL
ncbi:MAG: tRNA (N(6)-L-threonylcarbamoyladenosine(37)-C(2))-methylthiotransferase MtaB [Chloroflexi bacterium]|nr:tRNA (N(6)-L-threonylcarbamoyladenosine(37)-C(2))-methylthiotransferase MtaB [Chloroflexota bacterium]